MSGSHHRFLRELIDKSGLNALEGLARELLGHIPDDCVLRIDDERDVSAVVWQEKTPHALLELRLGSRARADVLWDFAHELGHVSIGYKPELLRDQTHERAAWDAGWALVVKLAGTSALALQSEYERRRDHCLTTYR